jgi:predicted GH43/DUF377 family glycosyl hydrolase
MKRPSSLLSSLLSALLLYHALVGVLHEHFLLLLWWGPCPAGRSAPFLSVLLMGGGGVGTGMGMGMGMGIGVQASLCHPLRFVNLVSPIADSTNAVTVPQPAAGPRYYYKCHDILRLIPDNTTMKFLDIHDQHITHQLELGPPLESSSSTGVASVTTYRSGCLPMKLEGQLYMRCADMIRLIPDKVTLTVLGFNESQIAREHDLKYGTPIPHLDGEFINYDHWLEINVAKFMILSGTRPLLTDISKLGDYFNPSLVPWKKDAYLLISRDGMKEYGGSMIAAWVNKQPLQPDKSTVRCGIGPDKTAINTDFVFGEDFRVLKINTTSYLLSYTGEWERWGTFSMCRMKVTYMTVSDEQQRVIFSQERRVIPVGSKTPYEVKTCEKNWVPFEYRGRTLFMVNIRWSNVVSIDPLPHIDGQNFSFWDQAVEVGKGFDNQLDVWKYGTIRGGTPALRLNNQSNLAFFHTKVALQPSNKLTYFIGAFVFNYEPPFQVTAISRVPIADTLFYSGHWYWGNNRYYDYVVYPMSFIFLNDSFDPLSERPCHRECLHEQELLLTIGFQDVYGYTAKLNLLNLLDSLIEIRPPG